MRTRFLRRKLAIVVAAASLTGGAGLIFHGPVSPDTAHWHVMVDPGLGLSASVDGNV